jgi:hypothetical protein
MSDNFPACFAQFGKALSANQIGQEKQKILPQTMSFWQKAEKFLLPYIPVEDEEITASKALMQSRDLWRLPYPVIALTYPCEFNLYMDDKNDTRGSIPVIPVVLLTSPTDWQFFFRAEGEKTWHITKPKQNNVFENQVQQIIDIFLVLIHTKGVSLRKELNNKELKPALLSRPFPTNTYTRVIIPTYAKDFSTETKTQTQTSRFRPRLHLRRGHIRKQPFGPKRSLTTEIYIQPTLVGYKEEGTIKHEVYEVD